MVVSEPNSPIGKLKFASPVNGRRPTTAPTNVEIKEVTDPTDVSGRYSIARKMADLEKNPVRPLPFCPTSALPPFIEHDRRLLVFDAYFKEDVPESALETMRVHICEICFYVEDGTLEIRKTKQENSGMPHGVFLSRRRVPKNGDDSSYFIIDDMKIGNTVKIYGREFHIVGCNESTKSFVKKYHGWSEEDIVSQPLPADRFSEHNREKMRRESGVPGVNRNRKMHELKEFMETAMGKHTSLADRGMFLECGQSALSFHVVWDDRERLYGDIQSFKLSYYLADNTVEIITLRAIGELKNAASKFVNRCKLPKPLASVNGKEHEYYTWRDLAIGVTITVFSRSMQVLGCDAFTREFYDSKGITLGPNITLEADKEVVAMVREIPMYNGFGSEEDSLRSCMGGIDPPPPKRDFSRMRDKEGVVLRFNATLVNDNSEDNKRRFVIQFFMEDGTISIREPPVKNSGIVGGNFMKRQIMKKPDGTNRYTASDMFVGNKVSFNSHIFSLLSADEQTYKAMECGSDEAFPYSDFNRLQRMLSQKIVDIKKYFVADYRGDGTIGMGEMAACCRSVGMILNEQEVITLWRKVDKKGKGKVSFTKLIKLSSDIYNWK
jgi:hypothetical protein